MFKKSRFQNTDYNLDFDSHFLRWMLSDGAGSCVLSPEPRPTGLSLKLNWVHTKSFSGDFPVCMQIGSPIDDSERSYLDYASLQEAEKAGSFYLRQNIRLLPHLFDVGINEFVGLVNKGQIVPDEVDHFLCHYSSQKFAPVIQELMQKAQVSIPEEKWFSNLTTKGNTGSASIYIMLDEFMREKNPKPGDKILCFIPESARFSISFLSFEVVGESGQTERPGVVLPESPSVSLTSNDDVVGKILRDLNEVWHDYRSKAWRSPIISEIVSKKFTTSRYLDWMENWTPQVRQGAFWMRRAISNLSDPYLEIKEIIEEHASEEQNDWKILYNDYKKAGGTKEADDLKRNRGGEALNAFMFHRADQQNAVDLLGAIYIIEGTGQKIIPALLHDMKSQTGLPPECFQFLKYHGENDEHHLLRWLSAIQYVVNSAPDKREVAREIINTARTTSQLYLMQLEGI